MQITADNAINNPAFATWVFSQDRQGRLAIYSNLASRSLLRGFIMAAFIKEAPSFRRDLDVLMGRRPRAAAIV